MNLLTTTQLAELFKVTSACVRQWQVEKRIKPAATLPNGHHLYSAATKRPKPRKRGPKT